MEKESGKEEGKWSKPKAELGSPANSPFVSASGKMAPLEEPLVFSGSQASSAFLPDAEDETGASTRIPSVPHSGLCSAAHGSPWWLTESSYAKPISASHPQLCPPPLPPAEPRPQSPPPHKRARGSCLLRGTQPAKG